MMKKVIFTGFFGMKHKHAEIYTNMWKNLGYDINYEPYTISDVLLPHKNFTRIRNTFKPKYTHYDIAYCISGGCLHMHNLMSAKNNFTIDKVVFDSGPYLFSSNHIENYIHNTYFTKLYKIPLTNSLDYIYEKNKVDLKEYNREYNTTLLSNEIPKLILTSKNDNIIVRPFINSLIKNNIQHHEFEKGKHANLYKYNKDYVDIINNFIKNT